MFKDFLTHKCDIYHGKKVEVKGNFGLTAGFEYTYEEEPDITAQICHISVKGTGSLSLNQGEPFNAYQGKLKLVLPYGTDIRLNDKVVSCETGLEYIAEFPRNIQKHHVMVYIHRNYSTGGYI